MYRDLLLEQSGPVATITLNRPEKRNPVNEEMLKEFLDILDKLRDDPENRIVIITGSGPAFCSGADITRLKGATTQEERHKQFDLARGKRRVYLHRALETVERLEQVTVAAINGYAIGGGLHLALACDFRIAVDSAMFWYPEIDLGAVVGSWQMARLMRIVGPARVKEMILTGDHYTAQQMLEMGVLTKVVSRDALLAEANAFASKLLAKKGGALVQAKAAINALASTAVSDGFVVSPHQFLRT